MKNILLNPLNKPVEKEIRLPGSLSFTIRAIVLAAMTKGRVKIINPARCDDVTAMVIILKTLGIKIKESNNSFIVEGDLEAIKNKHYELNAHLSGRTARTALALLTIVPGEKLLTCDKEFKKRPIGDLVDGLRQIGAKIEFIEKEGYLPVRIISDRLNPGLVRIKGSLSSQFISALLMIAPIIGGITIEVVDEPTSKPFIDMTLDILKDFGIQVINDKYKRFKVQQNQVFKCANYLVESDATSAGYFWAIAAVTGSKIRINNISPLSIQGDIFFSQILRKMGCVVRKNILQKWIEVQGTNKLHGIDINMNSNPDIAQTLTIVAAFSKGKTLITGLNNLKFKETDRIEAPKKELIKMGIKVASNLNSLQIIGGKPHGALIDTHGDHRMAMSFAVAGAKIDGVKINNPMVVNKSFPGFWEKIESLGVGIVKGGNKK